MVGTMARSPLRQAEAALRRYALGFPEAVEEFPWDERVIKVGAKIFVFLGEIEGCLRVGMKLPVSAEMALTLPFTTPTSYGLGRAGWVTARFGPDDAVPVDLLKEWIAQSYRAVAPRKLLKMFGAPPAKTLKQRR
jgi:predicted DNA-binding protein (MmcQ/YjbR family)